MQKNKQKKKIKKQNGIQKDKTALCNYCIDFSVKVVYNGNIKFACCKFCKQSDVLIAELKNIFKEGSFQQQSRPIQYERSFTMAERKIIHIFVNLRWDVQRRITIPYDIDEVQLKAQLRDLGYISSYPE